MVTANIIKCIYLNNVRWDDVDTNSINGVIDRWGPSPSSISFSLNRHMDSPKKDNPLATPAKTAKHLDNIKLFIAPKGKTVDGKQLFNQQDWPLNYEGTGNYDHAADPVDLDDYLRWQGVYVDPILGFSMSDNELSHSENFDVTAYDYRWCLNKCLFRTPPLKKRTWESGAVVSGDSNWSTTKTNIFGYSFNYNDFAGRCDNEKPNPWPLIVEHILKTASINYSQAQAEFDGSRTIDPGCIAAHIPAYDLEDEGLGFKVVPAFSGIRLNNIYSELILNLENGAAGDYEPLESESDTPFAPPDSFDLTAREFIPDPISLSNTYLMTALQTVLDSVGNIQLYMDQWNVLHFERIAAAEELADPFTDLSEFAGKEDNLYDGEKIYLLAFADDSNDVTDPNILKHCNVRGISNLKPRAVPEANRVIGQLKGRAPVSNRIYNSQNKIGLGGKIPAVSNFTFYTRDTLKKIKGKAVFGYHRSDRLYYAVGKIAKPIVTPFRYKTWNKNGDVIYRVSEVSVTSGWLLEKNAGLLASAPGGDGTNCVKTTVEHKSGAVSEYRYVVTYSVDVASVRVQKNKPSEKFKDKNDKTRSGGGYYIALNEPAYSKVEFIDGITYTEAEGEKIILGELFITHSWGAKGTTSNHVQSHLTNGDADVEKEVCINSMGIAPAAEIFSIDSSYQDDNYNNWNFSNRVVGGTDLREPGFPGLGDYSRNDIDAKIITKTVEELTPNNTAADDDSWDEKWDNAKFALAKFVKMEAIRLRQLVTEANQPALYDSDIKLSHRVCLIGTRDDDEKSEQWWMRLSTMKARINTITLNQNDELILGLTTELAPQEFSLFEFAARI